MRCVCNTSFKHFILNTNKTIDKSRRIIHICKIMRRILYGFQLAFSIKRSQRSGQCTFVTGDLRIPSLRFSLRTGLQPASGRSSELSLLSFCPCLAASLVWSEFWRLLRLHGLIFRTFIGGIVRYCLKHKIVIFFCHN